MVASVPNSVMPTMVLSLINNKPPAEAGSVANPFIVVDVDWTLLINVHCWNNWNRSIDDAADAMMPKGVAAEV